MSNRIPEEEVLSFFKERDDFLIFTHNSPDGDTVGSAMALVMGLRSLGKRAVAYNREGVPERLAFLPFGAYFLEEVTDVTGYTLVSVDVASPKMLSLPEIEELTCRLQEKEYQLRTIAEGWKKK